MTARTRSLILALALLSAAAPLQGCGDEETTAGITEVREVPRERAILPPALTTEERFGMVRPKMPPQGHGQATTRPTFTWTKPAGWEERPAGGMRAAAFGVPGHERAECTVIVLDGTGGGLLANVNRWRRSQMGLEEIDGEAAAALPRKPLLGGEAVFVDLQGTYVGMGKQPPLEKAAMLGLIQGLGGKTLFVKLVGPAAVVEAQRTAFDAFAASLKREAGSKGPTAPAASPAKPPSRAKRISWTTPEGWKELPGSRWREVSFVPSGTEKTSCYIVILGGGAGGVPANVNEWRKQVGLGPLDADDFAGLRRLPMAGVQGVLVEAKGAYRSKQGAQQTEAMLLGAIAERAADTVFVKMVGPAAEVEAQRQNFEALCRSLGH